MANSSSTSASSTVINVHWPLYTVYPAAIVFFYCAYFLFIPLGIRLCCQKRFNVLTRLNKRCFIQNINSCLHAFAIVSSLFIVLAGDHEMRDAGVAPHYNVLAYCEVCVSLGYMSFVLPWSLHMYFVLKARRPYTSATFCVHHATVVVAEVVYLLTQTCALHGALTVALMEFTNWFFLPLILMTQLDIVGLKKAPRLLGAAWALGVLVVPRRAARHQGGDRRHVGRGVLEGQVVVPVVLPGGGAREAPRAPEAARGAERAQARARRRDEEGRRADRQPDVRRRAE